MLDFDDLKPWLIGAGIAALVLVTIGSMISINVHSAIAKCKEAGYATPNSALSVTSCPADPDYSFDSIGMVVGNVANSPKPTLTDEVGKYLRNSIAKTHDDLKPFIYSATPSGTKLVLQNSKTRKSGNVISFVRNSIKEMASLNDAINKPPIENGADYFNNISAAAHAAKTSPKTKKPLVIVIGSGLSDAQPLNFAKSDLLHAQPKEILDQLKANGDITANEFSGLTILWSGLGVTVAPQKPLDAKERSNLRQIYQMIFEYMGATFITDDTVMAADSVDTDKTVSQIKVNGIGGGIVIYKLGERSIGFEADTANIVDLNKAEQAVGGIIGDYKSCPSVKITIEGYQARPDGKIVDTSQLSQSRADAVKGLLVTKGVNASSITSIGRGSSDFQGRVNERDTEGNWSTDRAQANRVVIVTVAGGSSCSL